MVYHGKPSSGCACCKRRRKKCDETRPQCRNCQKIGVECPGFPDKLDIMFKDETPTLLQRALRSPKRSPPIASTSPSRDSPKSTTTSVSSPELSGGPSENVWSIIAADPNGEAVIGFGDPLRDHYPTPGPAIGFPPELMDFDQALSISHTDASFGENMTRLFLSHFESANERQILVPGLIAVIKPWLEVVPLDSGLRLVVQAIAVRTMVTHHQRPDLLCRANAFYYQAIATVQVSIIDTVSSIHDDTLLTILLFAAYESLSTKSIANWSDHVRGAYSVLESRTPQRIDSPTSLILFRATRGNVLADALRQWERMPELSGSYGWLEGEPNTGGSHVFEQFVELTHLLGRTKELWGSTTRDQESLLEAENMIERAMQLQEVLADPQSCIQRNCTCISIVHLEDSLENGASAQVLYSSEPESYSRWTMPISPTRHYCYIGQLYCSRLITRLAMWIEPTQYPENERFQAASHWTKHLHEVVQASVPPYLTGAAETNASTGPPISISQLAQGLHMPPLHWALVLGTEKERG